VSPVDGPALRSLRARLGVPLRRIARVAGMSHGHLSKVETGEYGRPVTPAVINAYQRVLGVDIAAVIADHAALPEEARGWQPTEMTAHQRRAYASQVAAVAVGAPPGKPPLRLLQHAGPVPIPEQLDVEQLASLREVAELLERLGGLAGHLAHALLDWVHHLPTREPQVEPQVVAVIASLARRAARSAVSINRHQSARTLLLMALDAATNSGSPDLRARVLADIAEHHLISDYPEECLTVLRFTEGDERLSEEIRSTLKEIRNRVEARDNRESASG